MKKLLTQNNDGGTEIHFDNHIVTVQISGILAPPETVAPDAFSTWMKLDDGKWIPALENNHMKTVERIIMMKPYNVIKLFQNEYK